MDLDWLNRTFGPSVARFYHERENRVMTIAPRFHCPDSCARPCCIRPDDTYANVSLFDILLIAATLDERPVEFFDRTIELGVSVHWTDTEEYDSRLWQVKWRLKRPCPLLTDGHRCLVNTVKPLGCRLFPELPHTFSALTGRDAQHDLVRLRRKHDYECAQPAVQLAYLGDDLMRRIHPVSGWSTAEMTASDLLLFGRSPFIFDITPNKEEIFRRMSSEALAHPQLHGRNLEIAVIDLIREKAEAMFRTNTQKILTECESPKIRDRFFSIAESWFPTIMHVIDHRQELILVCEPDLTLRTTRLAPRFP